VKRRAVKVIKSRLEDIEVGDVVNRSPEAELGWFTVDAITTLFNGHLQLADVTEQLTVSGDHKDMVGLQLVEEIELDDRGFVAPPAAPVVAAAVSPTISTETPVDLTTGDDLTVSATPSDVDLALVAELLEELDVGEEPDERPGTPSYKNPVVVPEGTVLPQRSEAA
jgi:hypothetical protein